MRASHDDTSHALAARRTAIVGVAALLGAAVGASCARPPERSTDGNESRTVFTDSALFRQSCLEADSGLAQSPDAIKQLIGRMEAEHDAAGEALATMHAATDGYQPPEWACNTYRAMLDGLAQLERDMHQHVHKENNILFPRAARQEALLSR